MGENSTRQARNGCCYGLHAEMDAIRKLPPIPLKAKKKKINLIVIRIDRFGNLRNSGPCFKCIQYMQRLNLTTSYKIENVYYSDQDGNIVVIKLADLIDQENKHVSYAFRKKVCRVPA